MLQNFAKSWCNYNFNKYNARGNNRCQILLTNGAFVDNSDIAEYNTISNLNPFR